MNSKRLTWIDYARGIAIILVVYRHVFQGLKESGFDVQDHLYLEYANIFFFSFRMPLFFIISGLFVSGSLQKKGLQRFIGGRAKSVLYPYFLWACIQLTLQAVFAKYTNGHPTVSTYLYLFYLPREIAQFWYLYALFNVAVVFVVIKTVFKPGNYLHLALGFCFFLLSVLAYHQKIDLGFIGDILHYYFFFALGDVISRIMLNRANFPIFESVKGFLILLCLFAIAQLYFLKTNLDHAVDKYLFVEYHQPLLFLLIALIGCAFITSVTFILQKKEWVKWLSALGRHSLYIYVAHVIVFAATRILLNKVFGVTDVVILLLSGILAGLIVPVILYRLSIALRMPWIFTLEANAKSGSVTQAVPLSSPANETRS